LPDVELRISYDIKVRPPIITARWRSPIGKNFSDYKQSLADMREARRKKGRGL
jgi:hypothetical protein